MKKVVIRKKKDTYSVEINGVKVNYKESKELSEKEKTQIDKKMYNVKSRDVYKSTFTLK